MKKRQKLVAVIFAAAVGGAIIYAHAAGPDPRHTAAPGDDPLACATAGCHTGTPLNGGGGNVQVQFANGRTYTPGVPQTFTIVITDSVARVYGFQMTARLESNLANGQAGNFTPGAHQIVICDDSSLATASGCPTGQVEFIEHNLPFQSNTITVSWTPPSTNVGNVHIYVAANAANGDQNNTGDHIYTANYTLTPAAGGGPTPSISAVTSLTFNGITAVAPGSAVAVFGSNLASNGTGSTIPLPNTLGGSQVLFGSIAAPIYASSSGLINVQVPWEVGTGTVNVFVSNNGITSAAFPIQVASIAPGVWPVQIGSKVYGGVVNVGDGTFAWPTGIAPGAALPQHPAKANDILSIYSTGLGP